MPREPPLCQFGLLIFVCDGNDLALPRIAQLSRFKFYFEPQTLNFKLSSSLIAPWIGRPTHMQMTQIM
jgi:hypothetical protein